MTTAPFPVDRRRTAISIAFDNNELIADRVFVRVPSNGSRFTWRKYKPGETYALQDTLVGRTSKPNEVEFGFDEYESNTEDHGLEALIPQNDIDNAPQGYDPVDSSTRRTTNYVLLRREKRVADMVANLSNYSPQNVTTLTGTNRFTNYTINPLLPGSESDPVGVISNRLKSMLRRANTMVLSEDGFDTLSRHPKMVAAFHGNDGNSGVVTVDFIQRLFRLREVVIGGAWASLTPGSDARGTANITRLWGNDLALIYKDPTANLTEGLTWGMTAQWKTRITNTRFDPDIGLEGGQRVRVGEHVKEVVTAPEFGSIIVDAFGGA